MTINVVVTTYRARLTLVIKGDSLSECFEKIPKAAADIGVALLNDGVPVSYEVRVVDTNTSVRD